MLFRVFPASTKDKSRLENRTALVFLKCLTGLALHRALFLDGYAVSIWVRDGNGPGGAVFISADAAIVGDGGDQHGGSAFHTGVGAAQRQAGKAAAFINPYFAGVAVRCAGFRVQSEFLGDRAVSQGHFKAFI